MFTKKDTLLFIFSILLIIVGYTLMATDADPNGFGSPTLLFAPPLLLMGFLLPIAGICGTQSGANSLLVKTGKNAVGLFVFLLSLSVYSATLEPTASLWDCSDFIASSFKLQVPHTPGTPLSLLMAKVFSLPAFDDPGRVAVFINFMSAFFSSLTIWLVYHIIHRIGDSMTPKATASRAVLLIAAALTGSLCLAFSDSFWYSAVEAETYGAACFVLVLLFWLILEGQDLPREDRSRRMVLIFYLSGLGYCVHPMCLLALPVLPLVWFRTGSSSRFIPLILFAAGMLIVLSISRLVAVGLFEILFFSDLFAVNTLHLPFYSGIFIAMLSAVTVTWYLLQRFQKHAATVWSVVFLVIGFAPYLMLFIRSNHNPPIDESNPENLAMIKSYMNRESYPSSPLLFGPYFDAQVDAVRTRKTIYHPGETRYEISGTLPTYHYEQERSTILPRMYSNDPNHIAAYRSWTGMSDSERPGFSQNLVFMFNYQIGYMYLRYVLWNFAGREGDRQGADWLTPWDGLGRFDATVNNRANNQYFMIPLLAGFVGMWFQWRRNARSFFVVLAFFLATGLVLALYLNSTPNEPRERDYIYVGSYIAYSIWIGLSLPGLATTPVGKRKTSMHVAAVMMVCMPFWMLVQNYDDHDRSGRTFQVDHAKNVLRGCAPNAILFTGGDNDTFPLWYVQEVEGFRTDVRVMVLSYLNTDWYINQLRKSYYESPAFKLTLDENAYRQYGPNDVLYVNEKIKGPIDAAKYLALLQQGHSSLNVQTGQGDSYNILPSKTLAVPILDQPFTKVGQLQTPSLNIHVSNNYMQKNALAIMDLIVSNRWTRPVYFNFTSLNTCGLELERHVVQEGNLYRLVPALHEGDDIAVDTESSYENLVEHADYSNLADPTVYFNYEDFQARMITPIRQSFNSLAEALLAGGDDARAMTALQFAVDRLYYPHLDPSYTNLQAAAMLHALGDRRRARALAVSLLAYQQQKLQDGDAAPIDHYLLEQAGQLVEQIDAGSGGEMIR
jgi:hypothetical protein